MSLSSKMQTLSSFLAALLFTQHTWKRMICVMWLWYRVFNIISFTKRANRRHLSMADLQILPDGWMDTYGMNCNYKIHKETGIISCNSNSGAGVPQSVQRQGYDLQVRGWNPGMGKRFFVSPKHPDRLWGPPRLLIVARRVTFTGIKRPEPDVHKWSPSTAEVMNEWSYTPIPSISNHGVDRNYFTFTFTFSSENYVKWGNCSGAVS